MSSSTSTEPVIPLWEGPAPHSNGSGPLDIPTLTVYLPKGSAEPTAAILVCPGGGYQGLAIDHEGYSEGRYFRDKGIAAFVLTYRLPFNGYRHPTPLLDVSRAMRLVRSRAREWNLNPAKVGVMGFSAGGHLASTLITHFDAGSDLAKDPVEHQPSRPDYAILVYPVISLDPTFTHIGSRDNLLGPDPDPVLVKNLSNELQVTPQTPPTVLVHAADDEGVPIKHSHLMHAALQKAGVATELHEYAKGGHGFGHGPNEYNNNEPEGWLDRVYAWIKLQGFAA
jgi:acetyl esterase/lipase